MSIHSSLRRLASRVSKSIRKDRFRPVYEPELWLRKVLRASAGAERRGGSKDLSRSAQDADRLIGLVHHFTTRHHPKFLFDLSSSFNAHLPSHGRLQRWISLACAEVADMRDGGLTVYGVVAPRLRPGFAWDGSWYAREGDVLYRTRPHRFAFAPRLALAIVGGRYSSREFAALMHDWMKFARTHPELPFISTFVVFQRLLALTCTFYLLPKTGGDPDEDELRAVLLQVISQDIGYLIPRIGNSYPNVHLLADRFAGWFIATIYPEFCNGQLNLAEAERLWLADLERQTYDDGGSIEHSVHYHGLATEMAAVYWLLKRRNGAMMEPQCEQRIRELLRFQADLAGPDGNAPPLGDATEDPMLPLDAGMGTTSAMLREIYRRICAPAIPPLAPEHPAQERAFWLLAGEPSVPSQPSAIRSLSANPVSGIFSFFEHEEATRLVFRTGPAPEVATMSGHMHADVMSVCLIYKGTPLIVDSGTYSYRYEATQASTGSVPTNWRKYLAGPSAHNGIVIDGHDPLGTVSGDFRSGPSSARARHTCVIEGETLTWVEAESISPPPYANFVRGVIHVKGEYFLVYNVLAPETNAGDVIFPLQLDPRAQIEHEHSHAVTLAVGGGANATIVYSDELLLAERHAGQQDPPRGWVSPAYGVLRPALQLLFRPVAANRGSAFAFCLKEKATMMRITSDLRGSSPLVLELTGPDFRDWLFVNPTSPEKAVSHAGVDFKGRLLWLRLSASGEGEMRALDCAACIAPSLALDFRSDTVQKNLSLRWRLH